ncbi:hypothetical protein H310_06925 [Aphanomyces invadans]|uniref:DDE-1 domain-containing protein n=1 Tax=Aphanomyces invadans TaxID=157072 RepID=A0A024U573_9STRA|nr:hypothetical protein H310_06925 [Aphanomyces invadans]ETW01375.1 hypothetical protein H310_06925 [Aphanomyces invadans]|eukprot:XP_008870373.1 hypothetical protein H310_06925 [Aphanomyces invadans]
MRAKDLTNTDRNAILLLELYSSTVKPQLTDANKAVRLQWAIEHVRSAAPGTYTFDPLYDSVHVDEKWFFATRVKQTYYLAPGEKPPHRTCKSKRFIKKVMFLSAVARPRWNDESGEWFDGKIGTWHFTELVPAERSSRNRPAGTLVTTPVAVTRPVYKDMLVKHVIPAIKTKWPKGASRRVFLQQDFAKPHVAPTDDDIIEACSSGGWAMELKFQPPNSPDLNVLDLGFFRSIQTIQEENFSRSVDDIIAATDNAWRRVDMMTLNSNFLTLQCCMLEIIRFAGCNSYKIPHMRKNVLSASGRLPESVMADGDVIDYGFSLLCATVMEEKFLQLAAEVSESLDMADFSSEMEKLSVDGDLDEEGDNALDELDAELIRRLENVL